MINAQDLLTADGTSSAVIALDDGREINVNGDEKVAMSDFDSAGDRTAALADANNLQAQILNNGGVDALEATAAGAPAAGGGTSLGAANFATTGKESSVSSSASALAQASQAGATTATAPAATPAAPGAPVAPAKQEAGDLSQAAK